LGVKSYLVGGAVRDALLGLPVKDKDWVVVGATPEEMLDAGYQQVGRDFPVFLHPKSREEYALARTERKSGSGYTGFTCYAAPDVTLEQDLLRRDLTINALAQDETGRSLTPMAVRTICATAFYVTSPRRFLKIRSACCAWRALPRVTPISVSVLPMRQWR
jgi:hypothetical protein